MRVHPVLSQLARFGQRLGLERMQSFLRWLGDPHLAVPVVHVAGTNGKGSVVRMVGSILRAGGKRVGEYTSPHLQEVNERIVVDGTPIEDAELDALLHHVVRARDAWVVEVTGQSDPEGSLLTYFEVMTAAAFLYFARNDVDVVVLEVGLGGRLDATNVVSPAVTGIVSVGLDHTAQLGPDCASIAAEKAGIVKPGVPLITGPLQPDALRVVRSIAAERGAPLQAAPESWRVEDRRDGLCFVGPGGTYSQLELALAGGHQAWNAGVAIGLVQALPPSLSVGESAIRDGLRNVVHAGRIEQVAPGLWVDCAHNGDGAEQLAAFLRELPPDQRPRTLVLGMSNDKDARPVGRALAPLVDRILTTHCSHPRAVSAGTLGERLGELGKPVLPAGPIEQALPMARAQGAVIVAGSVFLVGAVRDLSQA